MRVNETTTEDAGRIVTGTTGLDEVLGGGLTPNRLYLVEGTPGSGKTTLALRFLIAGRDAGEAGLYVTLSETEDELRAGARSHGWDLTGIELFELGGEDEFAAENEQSLLHPSEIELGETVRGVMARAEASRPRRVVLDCLSELRLLAQNPLRYRRQILVLKQFFARRDCTVLMLDDRTSGPADLQLHSIAHGVIMLEQSASEFGAERRRLRVVKFRGVSYRGGWHDFAIRQGGLRVWPRLAAAEHHSTFDMAAVSTGLPNLDALLGNGLVTGTSTLLTGPAGVGKTTTAICCTVAALMRGERAAYFLFDERLSTLMVRSRALGMDLVPHVEAGRLEIRQIDPAELSPGEFAATVRHAVEVDGVRTIVIDSLNAYLKSMPSSDFLLLQMHELLSYLNQRGVVSIMILGQHGVVGDLRVDVDVSYLSDTLVLMRFFEAEGEVRKCIAVIKTRTSDHERVIREFRIDAQGVRIGDPMVAFTGVLSGSPRYTAAPGGLIATREAGER